MIPPLETERMWARPVRLEDAELVCRWLHCDLKLLPIRKIQTCERFPLFVIGFVRNYEQKIGIVVACGIPDLDKASCRNRKKPKNRKRALYKRIAADLQSRLRP
jgi:hypothetical protein